MGRSLWVHMDDMVKEGVPALLSEITNVGKASSTCDISILDLIKPARSFSNKQ